MSSELPAKPTMHDARELLESRGSDPPTSKQIRSLIDAGFKVVKSDEMTAEALDR